ncbi:HD domain-containing protein [Paenibacillus abyssi]|uniref:5'-deoxynucleotidase n=1 Tax=Paenibacillus abyssi TaxID=1340531 RepID=A0A917FZE5_9BACL|nr:HD domain-containing protein [Paenibacillus abyssi]GGG15154.1 hydrolase [Paenibacillus abyssi]
MDRLRKQLAFLVEIDKLKGIVRRSKLIDKSRVENDAEHSWHLAMMAIILSEYANEKVDLQKVISMLLIHDLVEIDAGDTYAYDIDGHKDKFEREQKAAERIFNILPEDQASQLYDLWIEFEKSETPEARFAAAIDRLEPLLLNHYNGGATWKENHITSEMVLNKNKFIQEGSEALWEMAQELIRKSVQDGILKP